MPATDSQTAFEAAGRLGAIETLAAQLGATVSMLRALYATHPEPAKVKYHFDRFVGQLLGNPDIAQDPDHATILRDMAATLFRAPADIKPAR